MAMLIEDIYLAKIDREADKYFIAGSPEKDYRSQKLKNH